MHLTDNDIETLEAVIEQMHDTLVRDENLQWVNKEYKPRASAIRLHWHNYKVVVFHYPAAWHATIANEEKLYAMLQYYRITIHAELDTQEGMEAAFFAFSKQILKRYGITDTGMRMMQIVHAIVVGTRLYAQQQGRWPINEKDFVKKFLSNQYLALKDDEDVNNTEAGEDTA